MTKGINVWFCPSHIMWGGAEMFWAFPRPVPLYKKSLLLPMHWTSPCEATREKQGKLPSEASDYCMFVVYYCMFITLN